MLTHNSFKCFAYCLEVSSVTDSSLPPYSNLVALLGVAGQDQLDDRVVPVLGHQVGLVVGELRQDAEVLGVIIAGATFAALLSLATLWLSSTATRMLVQMT